MVIPSCVTSIGFCAFDYCSTLRDVYSLNVTPPSCDNTFDNDIYDYATLYVPTSAVADYESADEWCEFSKIVGIDVDEHSGIDQIVVTEGGKYDVYSISGVRLMTTTISSEIESFPEGLYIVNGKKVVIKR